MYRCMCDVCVCVCACVFFSPWGSLTSITQRSREGRGTVSSRGSVSAFRLRSSNRKARTEVRRGGGAFPLNCRKLSLWSTRVRAHSHPVQKGNILFGKKVNYILAFTYPQCRPHIFGNQRRGRSWGLLHILKHTSNQQHLILPILD